MVGQIVRKNEHERSQNRNQGKQWNEQRLVFDLKIRSEARSSGKKMWIRDIMEKDEIDI